LVPLIFIIDKIASKANPSRLPKSLLFTTKINEIEAMIAIKDEWKLGLPRKPKTGV
jgi:hypothetical protein